MKPIISLFLLCLYLLIACTAAPGTPSGVSASTPRPAIDPLAGTSTPASSDTAAVTPSTPLEAVRTDNPPTASEEITSRISAISPVTIYSGPGNEYEPAGTLEAGADVQVLETGDDNWMKIACPGEVAGSCWVLWNPDVIYFYEGPAKSLKIPDPASLKFETVATETSPDGRWQAIVTKSEVISLAAGGGDPWFFYVELKVTSQEHGRTWTAVSEWHGAGLGEKEPPQIVHWSKDGRFLYYTSPSYPDGACVYYDNIGESFDRLDLTDGSVAALQPPDARGILVISPDEAMIAYLHGETYTGGRDLVVRELTTAYEDAAASQNSVKWQIPLDASWPDRVSQIAWTPDSKKVVVSVTGFTDYCQPPARITAWELNVQTGEWMKLSDTPLPTATP